MADAAANVAGSVSVEIGGNIVPFESALAKAEAMATAFNAKMETLLSGSGASSSLSSVNTSIAETSTALIAVTAPAVAAAAKIDAVATSAVTASTAIDGSGISAKALAAALAITGNNLEKATALMVANADAAKVQAAAIDTVAVSSAEAGAAIDGMAGANVAAAIVQTSAAAKGLGAEVANTGKLSAGASAEILRIGNDAARGNFGRLTSAAVVLSTRLGEGGASALTFGNALSTIGGLAEVALNPVFLAIVGIPLALDLAVKGFEALSSGGKSLNDVLKEQKTYLDQLTQSFPDAGKAAEDFLKIASGQSTSQAVQSGFQSTVDLQNQQNSARQGISDRLRAALNPAGNGPDLQAQFKDANSALGDLSGTFTKLLQDFVSGKTTAAQLSTELADLYVNPQTSQEAKNNITQFEALLGVIQKTQAGIDANAVAAARLTSAYQNLAIAAAERKDELAATDSVTKALQFQISTLGQSNSAVAAAKEYQEVWNAGIEAGRSDLQELASQAASAAGQVAGLTSAFIAASAHSDLQFSISMVGLSTAQQAAAKSLRAPGQSDAGAVLSQPGASDTVVNDTLTEFIALTKKADPASKAAQADLAALGKSGEIPAATMAILNQRMKDFSANGGIKAAAAAIKPFDNALQSAKADTANLVAQQQALGLTAEQADKLTESQKLLNEATKKGTDLSPDQLAAIDKASTEYAKQKAQLQALTDIYDTGQQDTEDFFSTLKTSLQNGESVWQSFGDAASKVLDDIANKALQFASDGIWNSIFGAAGGSSGGGILGGVLKLFGIGGGASSAFAGATASAAGFASGGYTGSVGVNTPAGVVHGQEFVVNAAATARNRPMLEAINAGVRGYKSGGFVDSLPGYFGGGYVQPIPSANGNGPRSTNGDVSIHLGDTHINGSGLSEAQLTRVLAKNNQAQIDLINSQFVPVVHDALGLKMKPGTRVKNEYFRKAG